jgi:hypothetical protein
MQIYQDIWVNGEIKQEGIRECAARFAPIKKHCKQYARERAFTVLDIGACLGYFSFRLVNELPCVSTMVEANKDYLNALAGPSQKGNHLSGLIQQQNRRNRLTLLNRRLTLSDLQELNKCEHFDIVLALRVVHHFKEPFADVIEAIVNLGDHTFLELPTDKEPKVRARTRVCQELADHSVVLKKYNYKLVAETPSHVGPGLSPMYLIKNEDDKRITRPYWGSSRNINHTIASTFDKKILVKEEKYKGRGARKTNWLCGINLYTYHILGGTWPSRKYVSNMIKNYKLPKNSPLTDIALWNFIISGERIDLIDHDSVNDSRGHPFPKGNSGQRLNKIANQVLRGKR